jgi:outer membrane protein OmpA-like peptidoglycan-associated protein
MPLLRQQGTARTFAMGSAFTGLESGAASVFLNPAGLGALESFEICFNHGGLLADGVQENAVFGMRQGSWGSFALSLNYQNSGPFEIRDDFGNLLSGMNTAGELGVQLGWGREMLPGFYAGASLKAIQKNLAEKKYYIFAGDAGILWKAFPGLTAGIVLLNAGTGLSGSPLPLGMRAGAAWGFKVSKSNSVVIAAGCEAGQNGEITLNAGFETTAYSILSVRLGYMQGLAPGGLSGFVGITAGLGVSLGDIRFDYAFLPYGELGNMHRAGITYAPPAPAALPPETKKYLPQNDSSVITFETAYFKHDSAELAPETRELLEKNIAILKKYPDTEIRITGHTSKSGSRHYNLKLSEKRAVAIRNYIIREGGIQTWRIFVIGYGDTHPAVFEAEPGQTDSDAARLNRRGFFEIIRQ